MKGNNIVIILFAFLVDGVFGDTDAVKSVSVLEGDPVTLNTDITKQHHDITRWYFNGIRIALINGGRITSCLYDGEDRRFRGRLEVDYETGSLTITDITSEHAGRYEAELIRSKSSGNSQSLNRNRTCDSTKIIQQNSNPEDIIKKISLTVSDAVKSVSVLEGDPVTLNTDITKQHHDITRWYFNGIRIALINGGRITSCLYDGEDRRFSSRLEVDYETGSLTITDITSEHAGRYEAELIRSKSSGNSQSLNRNRTCDSTKIIQQNSNPEDIIKKISLTVSASDSGKNKKEDLLAPQDKEMETTVPGSGLSSGVVGGIAGVLGVLLVVAAFGVIYSRCRIPRNDKNYQAEKKKNNQGLLLKV